MSKKTIAKILSLWKKGRNVWEISQLTGATERQVVGAVNSGDVINLPVGRPPSIPTKPAMIRLTEVQREKFLELGGSRWVKRLIDEAINPKRNAE